MNERRDHFLTIGLLDMHTKTQKIDSTSAKEIIMNAIFENGLDGCTLIDCTGVYQHEDGTRIIEPSIRVEIAVKTSQEHIIREKLILQIKTDLNQESIAYKAPNTETELI